MKTKTKFSTFTASLLSILFLFTTFSSAQSLSNFSSPSQAPSGSGTQWLVGGKIGLAIGSGFGGSSVGLQIGPMAEVLFNKNMGVGTELNINTFSGTPIEWPVYFKYYFDIPGSTVKPYANIGPSLWFATNGPFFAIRFGGGASFKVANHLYIPADIQLGPVFYSTKTSGFDYYTYQPTSSSSTSTIFLIAITTGIRYEIP